jgi:hypothetical protein
MWLPAAAAPTTIAGVGALADPKTGVLLSRAPLTAGVRYQITSQVPQYGAGPLRHAVPDQAAQADTALPTGLPEVIREAADAAAVGASSPFQQASQLERYLRSNARNDLAGQPGHTYGHLAYFLGVSHRGTSEQFATAFAVMARSLGLPTRIAVGFSCGTEIGPGLWEIKGGDALAWPEVDFAGLGWVPFFPTPNATSDSAAPSAGQSVERQALDEALAQPLPEPVPGPALPVGGSPPASSGHRGWLVAGMAAGMTPVAYLVIVLIVPVARTYRRRRRAEPAARVVAAWQDAVGLLRRVGVAKIDALTTIEVAALAVDRAGAVVSSHIEPLASLADAAAFSGSPSNCDSANSAWAHRDGLARMLPRTLRSRRALGRRLHPRVLRG